MGYKLFICLFCVIYAFGAKVPVIAYVRSTPLFVDVFLGGDFLGDDFLVV